MSGLLLTVGERGARLVRVSDGLYATDRNSRPSDPLGFMRSIIKSELERI